jgi:hypothetical protein
MTRRDLLGGAAALAAAPAPAVMDQSVVASHDKAVESYLRMQITEPGHRHRGGFADAFGLYAPGSAAGLYDAFVTAIVQPASRFHKDAAVADRAKLAADYLRRMQTADGNFNLPITNFNSPPDTAFIVRSAAAGARHARTAGERELLTAMEPTLRKAGEGLVNGGVHTPNHRWVCCAALAQLHELFGDSRYLRRIEQWLAESVDIDEDGQFSEHSTVTYNGVSTTSLTVVAHKLKRWELLEPVRRNLDALLYLLHPGEEAVTDVSTRQDQYVHSKPYGSWFPLRYLAVKDANGKYAALASKLNPSLSQIMEYPELATPGPALEPLPEDYDHLAPSGRYAHIRRGKTSATLVLGGTSRFFAIRHGAAILEAVRFSSAFFGKGQFVPPVGGKRGKEYWLRQELDAGYWQPADPPQRIAPSVAAWYASHKERRRTEVCRMEYRATVTEIAKGFRLRIEARGTDECPVSVEIGLGAGGKLEGCVPAPQVEKAWILESGKATLRAGDDTIRFGPGLREHSYTQVRGAEAKLPGECVYLCGYTPFDHTIEFEAV